MNRLEQFINLIKTGVEDKILDDSDIDLLITSVKMLLEEKSRKRRK